MFTYLTISTIQFKSLIKSIKIFYNHATPPISSCFLQFAQSQNPNHLTTLISERFSKSWSLAKLGKHIQGLDPKDQTSKKGPRMSKPLTSENEPRTSDNQPKNVRQSTQECPKMNPWMSENEPKNVRKWTPQRPKIKPPNVPNPQTSKTPNVQNPNSKTQNVQNPEHQRSNFWKPIHPTTRIPNSSSSSSSQKLPMAISREPSWCQNDWKNSQKI